MTARPGALVPQAPGPGRSGHARFQPALPVPARRSQPDFSLATVNIVLLLVLFFLVTGAIVAEEEAAIALPETRHLPLDQLPRPLLLVGQDGSLALDGVAITREALLEHLDEARPAHLYLLAGRDYPALQLLDVVVALGPTDISLSLVTLRDEVTP